MRGTTIELDEAARRLRQSPTEAEAMLWERLRARRLDGFKFRRQHPLGRFILDFCCASARLVIELDGPSHLARPDRDRERDDRLRAYGYRVIRVRNEDVLGDINGVLSSVRTALRDTKID